MKLVSRVFILLLVIACACQVSKDRPYQLARVLSIVDGDTIVLTDGRRVRYVSIDTPERGDHFFTEASMLNRRLVEGKQIKMYSGTRETDRYGRTLAWVEVDGVAVAETLITMGLAHITGYRDSKMFIPRLITRQREAMDHRRGIWEHFLEDETRQYVASVTAFRFHRLECPAAERIKRDQLLRYDSAWEAYYDGLSPCNRCQPHTFQGAQHQISESLSQPRLISSILSGSLVPR